MMCSLNLFKIRQFVFRDFCLSCLGCCRYNCTPSIWAPNLLEEEQRALGVKEIEPITSPSAEGEFSVGQPYICCFLDPQSNLCQVYARRPLECRLYPFLLVRCQRQFCLSIDLNCLFIKDKLDKKEFKIYRDYLLRYLRKPAVLSTLSRNRQIFSSYPGAAILNLAELRI